MRLMPSDDIAGPRSHISLAAADTGMGVRVLSTTDSALRTNCAGIDFGGANFASVRPSFATGPRSIPSPTPTLPPMTHDLSRCPSMLAPVVSDVRRPSRLIRPPASMNVRAALRFASDSRSLLVASSHMLIGDPDNLSAALHISAVASDFHTSASDFYAAGADFVTAGSHFAAARRGFPSRASPADDRQSPSRRRQSASYQCVSRPAGITRGPTSRRRVIAPRHGRHSTGLPRGARCRTAYA